MRDERTKNDLFAPLMEPLRRRIYESVRQALGPVTRDEVAAAVGISRKLAAFHLDKLLETGWLTASYIRDIGRSGPGAGRPPKRYAPSHQSLDLSIPARNYLLAGKLLAQAVALDSQNRSPSEVANDLAQDAGFEIGHRHRRASLKRKPGTQKALAATAQVLDEEGFEPCSLAGEIALRNCPFHDLAQMAPGVVCGMNQRLILGIVRGLGSEDLQVFLDPQPGYCCVRVAKPQDRRTERIDR